MHWPFLKIFWGAAFLLFYVTTARRKFDALLTTLYGTKFFFAARCYEAEKNISFFTSFSRHPSVGSLASQFTFRREFIACKVFWIPNQVGYDDMRLSSGSSGFICDK
ncbi:hypothetical protein JYT58_01365, partial [bacterium AH-315-G11]|nr:hypothetical protein [bacterium AH-315-G11]MBN4061537.1 hypothetical protein [bacterium AH-315-G11]